MKMKNNQFMKCICTTYGELVAVQELSLGFDGMLIVYQHLEYDLCVCGGNVYIWGVGDNYPYFLASGYFVFRLFTLPLDYLIEEGLSEQSGIEEDLPGEKYGRLKWNRKITRNKLEFVNTKKVLNDISSSNYGSRNKSKKKNIMHKLKYNTLYEQSGTDIKMSPLDYVNILEKIFLTYCVYNKDNTLMKILCSFLVFVPNGVIKTVYEEIMVILSNSTMKDMTLSTMLDSLKQMLLQWESFILNDFAKSFIEIVSKIWLAIISPGLVSKLPHNKITNMINIIYDYCKGMDILSALVKSAIYLCNAVDVFVKTGTFSGFVTTETIEEKLSKQYRELLVDFNLYKTGDLNFISNKSQFDFFKRTSDLRKDLENAMKSQVGRFLTESKNMLKEVLKMETECTTLESHKAAREMPYVTLILSGSGINKTHLMQLVAITILRANKYPHGPDYFYYLNDKDKFVSLWKNYTTCIMAEDTANARFVEGTETQLDMANFIIKAAGNLPHNLLSAEVDSKGKQYNRAPVMVLSSNSASQKIDKKSDFSSTVWRRFGCIIEASVRTQYRKADTSPSIDYSKLPENIRSDIGPDAWLFTLYRTEIQISDAARNLKKSFNAPQAEDNDDSYRHVVINDNGKIMKDVPLRELLLFLQRDSNAHFDKQRNVLDVSKKIHSDTEWCKQCKLPGLTCICPKLTAESGNCSYVNLKLKNYVMSLRNYEFKGEKISFVDVISGFKNFLDTYRVTLLSWVDSFIVDCIILICERIADKLMFYLRNPTYLIPLSCRNTVISRKIFEITPAVKICSYIDYYCNRYIFFYYNKLVYYLFCITYYYGYFIGLLEQFLVNYQQGDNVIRYPRYYDFTILNYCTLSSLTYYYMLKTKYAQWKTWWYDSGCGISEFDEILQRNAIAADILSYGEVEDDVAATLSRSSVLAYLATIIIPQVGTYFNSLYLHAEAGLDLSEKEMMVLDGTTDKPFFEYKLEKMLDPAPVSDKIKHTELTNVLDRNVIYVSSDLSECCNGIMLTSHYIMLPKHFCIKNMGQYIHCVRKPIVGITIAGNAKFGFYLSEDTCKYMSTDAAIVYTPTTGDAANVIKYFPTKLVRDETVGKLIYRDKNGIITPVEAKNIVGAANLMLHQCNINSEYKPDFAGYSYIASTFNGLCGAPLVDVSRKQSHIMGIHVAGNKTVHYGVSALILQSDIQNCISKFSNSFLVQQSDFSLESYGIDLQHGLPHFKSPIVTCANDLQGIKLICGTKNRVSPVSKVVKTPICDSVKEVFQHPYVWGAAPVRGPEGLDKKHAIKRYIDIYKTRGRGFKPEVLKWAKEDYTDSLHKHIKKELHRWSKEIYVLTDNENVQGIDGKKYINSMNMSTSMGKHLPGVKSKYATLRNGKWEFEPFVLAEFHKRDLKLREGFRTYEMFSANVKSEPTLEHKIAAGKSRIFFAAATHTQLLIRKYFLTTLRFFCTQTETTECCVGINPHSTGWNKIIDYFDEFKGKHYMALDMANFDIITPTAMIDAALDIILSVPFLFPENFSKDDKTAMLVLKHEILHAVVDFNGDVAIVDGIIPSGINITSILGSVVNSLYYRCAYYMIRKKGLGTFKSAVRLLTFGDDSIAKVHKRAYDIDMQAIIDVLAIAGVKATNGKKDDNKSKYYKLEELEFLKRKFRYDREFGCYVAQLDESSIYKSLSCLNPPKTVNIENITGSNVDGALFEMKFAGRAAYENFRFKITEIVRKNNLQIYCNCLDITFDEALLAWKKQYDPTLVTKLRDKSVIDRLRLCLDAITHSETWFYRWTPQQENINDSDHSVNKMVVLKTLPELELQSGIITNQQAVLGFTQSKPDDTVEVGFSDPRHRVDDPSVSLSDFLSRPTLIETFTWDPTVALLGSVNPWYNFLTNKRIANRINNYKLFKADLHVKIVVTGNPFMYGAAGVAYWPLAPYDNFSLLGASDTNNLVQFSQFPKIMINPSESTAGEMVLPFFWHEDYIDLTQTRIGGNPAATCVGTLVVRQFTSLRHANMATSTPVVTISVYAWAENVKVAGPTAKNMIGLTAQSGREDETVNKPISQAATTIADAAHIMSKVPVIGPYATALETAARTTSTIASAFGFSKPTVATCSNKMVIRFAGNTAVTNDADIPEKLSTDVKQELSIDPRIFALKAEDELAISYIVQRESYFDKFTWTGGATTDSFLWNIRISPMIARMATVVGPPAYNNYYMTAIGGASLPFSFWTGTIEIRFRIASSNFHKGKLAIVYDPNGSSAIRESNVTLTEIVDISTTNDICVAVSNHQPSCWLDTPNTFDTTEFDTTPIVSNLEGIHNGTLAVYVANRLTGPMIPSDTRVEVLCFIRAGKDFKLAGPRNNYTNYSPLIPQSGTVETGEEICVDFASDMLNQDNRVYMGEEISSFRNLLKRYNWVSGTFNNTVDTYVVAKYPLLPPWRGNATGDGKPVKTCLLNYLRPAYQGYRGGVRYKILYNSPTAEIIISRTASTEISRTATSISGATYPTVIANSDDLDGFCQGAVIFEAKNYPVAEFEVPFYSKHKFMPGKPKSLITIDPIGGFKEVIIRSVTGVLYSNLLAAASEDTTLLFFTGWPVMRVYFPVA